MYPKNNTVLLNGNIVGTYHDSELNEMVNSLSIYYNVPKSDFVITKGNPYELGLVNK